MREKSVNHWTESVVVGQRMGQEEWMVVEDNNVTVVEWFIQQPPTHVCLPLSADYVVHSGDVVQR